MFVKWPDDILQGRVIVKGILAPMDDIGTLFRDFSLESRNAFGFRFTAWRGRRTTGGRSAHAKGDCE
ncbi:MAG: hypothetical protein ACTS5I_03630 [Rhodanobacter sp.]